MEPNISKLSRILMLISGLLLIVTIFVPIWQIELNAPQYPEGLGLKIHANKLGGDVDIINGLNHYIGMKTLHAEDFIEFTLLPYIIASFALMAFIVVIFPNRKLLVLVFSLFVVFGILAMVDFWRWEYDYGHDLDPNAAIVVPGMAYQPPLIGYKQLLNFGAYSIPDIGGVLFILSGLLMLSAVSKESFRKKKSNVKFAVMFIIIMSMNSCSPEEPKPIIINKDNCEYCRMQIADNRFSCELITLKGRDFKFDDVTCMLKYVDENKIENANYFISDYLSPNNLIAVKELSFIKTENPIAPMGGKLIAFQSKDSAYIYLQKLSAKHSSFFEYSN